MQLNIRFMKKQKGRAIFLLFQTAECFVKHKGKRNEITEEGKKKNEIIKEEELDNKDHFFFKNISLHLSSRKLANKMAHSVARELKPSLNKTNLSPGIHGDKISTKIQDCYLLNCS